MGRLQVIFYDPDPNPKHEEQALARTWRFGQTKEVRVSHLETVVEAKPISLQVKRAPKFLHSFIDRR